MQSREINKLKVDLKKLIDVENAPLLSGDKSQFSFLKNVHQKEFESYQFMLKALQLLQSDLLKSEINSNHEKYVRAIRSIIDAARQQLDFIRNHVMNEDVHFNEEVLFLTKTIDLLHKTVNQESKNPTEFIALTEKFFKLEATEKMQDRLNLEAESNLKNRLFAFLMVAITLLAIACVVASIILIANATIAPILMVVGFVSILGVGSALCNKMGDSQPTPLPAAPAHNLVKTLFAAKCTAEACDISLSSQGKSLGM